MIYIVVRRTTDWADEAASHAHIPDGFQPVVELWDTTFRMPYHLAAQSAALRLRQDRVRAQVPLDRLRRMAVELGR
jgi:hypothetical protein